MFTGAHWRKAVLQYEDEDCPVGRLIVEVMGELKGTLGFSRLF